MPATIDIPRTQAFYEQEREPLPEKIESVVTANNLRVGAGTDIFAVGGSGFVFRSSLSESTVSSFGNGSQVINQVKVTNNNNKNIIAIVERTIYVDNDGEADDILIGGANIDESDWQIIGNNFSIIDTSGNTTGSNELTNYLYIRNISAGTVTLYIDVYVRYIINTNAS